MGANTSSEDVDKIFAAIADDYYNAMLPGHYCEILAKAVSPVNYTSKGELYNKLCESILIEGGTQRIGLNKSNDKVWLMVSAKALDITYGLDSRYWQWVSTADSSFERVAELKKVERFEVWQRIKCTLLSPDTDYCVSFVLKINKNSMASCPKPFTFSLKAPGGQSSQSTVYLHDDQKAVEGEKTKVRDGEKGWKEFVAGEFKLENRENSEIEVCMKNMDRSFSKSGIVIEGVKIFSDEKKSESSSSDDE